MNDPDRPLVTRLGELPRDIAPPRDGWPELEARLRENSAMPRPPVPGAGRHRVPFLRMRVAAVAALLAAVAAGISIDRLLLAPDGTGAVGPMSAWQGTRAEPAHGGPSLGGSGAVGLAGFVTDPRYLRERAELLRSLNARLAALPPQSRQQVLSSLETIHRSMREIQQALGREPANALLQELLVDSYQDEMRVLTAVQEASAGSGAT